MKGYNIFYQNNVINDKPLTKEEISQLYGKRFIKKISNTGHVTIPVNRCRIIECTIV